MKPTVLPASPSSTCCTFAGALDGCATGSSTIIFAVMACSPWVLIVTRARVACPSRSHVCATKAAVIRVEFCGLYSPKPFVNIQPPPKKFAARDRARIAWLALSCLATIGHAQPAVKLPQGYPNRPIRVIVGSAPGGGADIVARAVAQHLATRWNRPVIVDNRGGGGGVIALELLAQAAPDGYTLF